MIARFEPSRGTIPPGTEIQVYFSVTVFIGGNLNELFCCHIDDVELPIGFEMLADAFGLNVSYETTDDSQAAMSLTGTSFNKSKSQIDSPIPDTSVKSGGSQSLKQTLKDRQ